MYATDTRIGRGIMPPGKALRCSPGGPRKRRFAVFRSLGFMVLQQKNLPLGGSSGLYESVVCLGAFLLQKPPLLQSEFRIAKFTRKGA